MRFTQKQPTEYDLHVTASLHTTSKMSLLSLRPLPRSVHQLTRRSPAQSLTTCHTHNQLLESLVRYVSTHFSHQLNQPFHLTTHQQHQVFNHIARDLHTHRTTAASARSRTVNAKHVTNVIQRALATSTASDTKPQPETPTEEQREPLLEDEEDVTARAKASSSAENTNRWLRFLRNVTIFTLLLSYPIYIIRYNGPLPFQSTLIQQLRERGTDSWVFGYLPYFIWFTSFRRQFLEDEQAVHKVLEVLNPRTHDAAVYTPIVIMLFTVIPLEDDVREALAVVPGIGPALLSIGMHPDMEKETSYMALTTLSKLLSNKQCRDEFIAVQGLQQICRATRATSPEVANAATECVTALLVDFPNTKAMKLTPNQMNDVFMAVTNLGAMYAEQNQHLASIQAFKQSLQLDPANTAIMAQVGSEFTKIGDFAEAEKFYRRALKLDPANVESAYHLAKILLQQQQQTSPMSRSSRPNVIEATASEQTLREIVKSLGQAIDLHTNPNAQRQPIQPGQPEVNPLLSPAYNLLIRCLGELGRWSEAEEYARDWTLRSSADAISHFSYGRMLLRTGNYRNALIELRIARDLDPSRAETYYQLALAHYKLHHLDQSTQYLQKAQQKLQEQGVTTSLRHPLPNIFLLDGKLAMSRGQNEEAINKLRTFLTLKPDSYEGHIALAHCLEASGQTSDAYQQFNKLCTLWARPDAIPRDKRTLIPSIKLWSQTRPREVQEYVNIGKRCKSIQQHPTVAVDPSLQQLCQSYNQIQKPAVQQQQPALQ